MQVLFTVILYHAPAIALFRDLQGVDLAVSRIRLDIDNIRSKWDASQKKGLLPVLGLVEEKSGANEKGEAEGSSSSSSDVTATAPVDTADEKAVLEDAKVRFLCMGTFTWQ